MLSRLLTGFGVWILFFLMAPQTWAGSIILTGHDPDYHGTAGFYNAEGAQHLNQAAISYILDPNYNTFAAAGIHEFLYVEGGITPPDGHADGQNALISSGYRPGIDFETHNASDLAAQLNLLGTKYSGIVVGSDFGGILTQAELNILNAQSSQIIAFLNAGGGLFAMAEVPPSDGLASSGFFGYLPFAANSLETHTQDESGNTLTAFGASLGLTSSDINGNYSHNTFEGTSGLSVIDTDAAGDVLSMGGRGEINAETGLAPEPRAAGLIVAGMLLLFFLRRARAKRAAGPKPFARSARA